MEKDLRKRLEEAAENHCSKYDFEPTQRNNTDSGWEYGHTYTQLVKCFIAGAEYGYKEAIAMAKEWLECKVGNYLGLIHEAELTASTFRTAQLIADFETDINKHLEEKK